MYTQEEPEKSTKYQNVSGQHHKVYDIVFNVIIESNVQKIICKNIQTYTIKKFCIDKSSHI